MGEKKNVAEVVKVKSHFRSRIATADETVDDSVYHLKALTSSQMSFVYARAGIEEEDGSPGIDGQLLTHWTLKLGLAGWDNVVDEDGKQVKLKTTDCVILGVKYPVITNKLKDGLSMFVQLRLVMLIQEMSGLTDGEEQKLDFSSASGSAK